MKFYKINKPHGTSAVEAENIKGVKVDSNTFMVVAADSVNEGEIYQAIQVKPNMVQLNYKGKHEFVEASSITEALGGSTTETNPEPENNDVTKYIVTFETAHGQEPDPVEVVSGESINLPILSDVVSEDAEYKFKGWEGVSGNTYTPTSDKTLTAVWERIETEPEEGKPEEDTNE